VSLITGAANLMIALNQSKQVIEFLKKYSELYSNLPIIHELLAKGYSALGFRLLEHESLSNAFYYRYNIQEAIIQMDLATKSSDGNFYEKSRVDFRLKELKREAEILLN